MNDFSKNKIEQLKENSRFSPDNRILILKVKLKKQLELDVVAEIFRMRA